MALPSSFVTTAEADALVDQAAVAAGLSRSAWDSASADSRAAALQVATRAIASTPGVNWAAAVHGTLDDSQLKLATVVEALYRLDRAGDATARARARAQAMGVRELQAGSVRERYGPGTNGIGPATRDLLRVYRRPGRFT